MHKPKNKIYKWIILQILLITSLKILSVSSHDDSLNLITDSCLIPPKLTPSNTEVTIDYLMPYTVKCSGKSAVFWDKPYFYFMKNDWKIEETYEEDGSYSSVLTLENVSNVHVGNYMCRYKKYIFENIEDQIGLNTIASVYVFVRDPYPLARHVNHYVSGKQYSEAVIPCKPTNRDVSLTLKREGNMTHLKELIYEPKIGFIVKVFSLTDGGKYICSGPDIEEEHIFYLEVRNFINLMKRPVIEAPDIAHADIGKEFVITCKVNIKKGIVWEALWTGPQKQLITNNEHYNIDSPINNDQVNEFGFIEGVSRLTIRNVTGERDNGVFKCEIITNFSYEENYILKLINILGYSFVKFNKPNDIHVFEVKSPYSEAIVLKAWYEYCSLDSFNSVEWYNNRNNLIDFNLNNKYNITIRSDVISLTINNVVLEDTGNYTLKVQLVNKEIEMKIELIVHAAPIVSFAHRNRLVNFQSKELVSLKCQAVGFPPSVMSWSFKQCSPHPVWPTCSLTSIAGTPTPIINSEANTQIMEIKFIPSASGIFECHAGNSINSSSTKTEILLTDLTNPKKYMEIIGLQSQKIAEGESVTLVCSALAYNYTSNLTWYRDELPINVTDNLLISENSTPYSFQKILKWNTIEKNDAGVYECHATPIDGCPPKILIVNVIVHDPIPPKFIQIENKEIEKEFSLGEPLRHECFFNGIPEPRIRWLKDGVLLENNSRVHFTNDNNVLEITRIVLNDDGVYTCEGFNKVGSDSAQLTVKIKDKPTVGQSWIIGGVVVILLLIICTIILTLKIRQSRKRLRELEASGLATFEYGCIESLNPDMSLDEQADLLPYDKKYEFPRERLKLGKPLGSGAFGVVVKAEAVGIVPHEDNTTVAMKTLKPNADNEVMRALISELKIMIHMGQHLNVVNLLGAVTSNIAKRELLVIVEYCRFGNIQHFLQKHRSFFIDQINPETDEIDHTIEVNEQHEQDLSNDSRVEYNSCNAETNLISSGKPEEGDSSTSYPIDEPTWRSNYQMDYTGPTPTITTSNLVCWGFQVARGMNYLSSQKVLHGDLAARNILLCDDNVVKICDFGLARPMYISDNYKKKCKSPLPFKWLALESISDQVFSTYSDIWAYGVVLWEIFSLAKTPYPGMKADQSLYMQLRNGYRMEKPKYANQELYDLMLNCWNVRPESRPLFGQIEKKLGKMMQLGVMEHYVDLNEPYMQVNADLFSDSNKDYIAILGPPTEMAPPVPKK